MYTTRSVGIADETCVRINEFTDPACPWAYSAEPFRHRLDWLYEGYIEWQPADGRARRHARLTTRRRASPRRSSPAPTRRSPRDHRMPIDTRPRPYVAGSRAACKAVVAARVHAGARHLPAVAQGPPDRATSRARCSITIRPSSAPRPRVGIGDEIAGWLADPAVEEELERDATDARAAEPGGARPRPQARQLVRRPALHLPELRDHAALRRGHDRRPRLPAVRRLRRDPRQPRPRTRATRRLPARPPRCSTWRSTPLSTQEVAVVCDVELRRRTRGARPRRHADLCGSRRVLGIGRRMRRRTPHPAFPPSAAPSLAGVVLAYRKAVRTTVKTPEGEVDDPRARRQRARPPQRRRRLGSGGRDHRRPRLPRADLERRQPRAPRPRLLGLPAPHVAWASSACTTRTTRAR